MKRELSELQAELLARLDAFTAAVRDDHFYDAADAETEVSKLTDRWADLGDEINYREGYSFLTEETELRHKLLSWGRDVRLWPTVEGFEPRRGICDAARVRARSLSAQIGSSADFSALPCDTARMTSATYPSDPMEDLGRLYSDYVQSITLAHASFVREMPEHWAPAPAPLTIAASPL